MRRGRARYRTSCACWTPNGYLVRLPRCSLPKPNAALVTTHAVPCQRAAGLETIFHFLPFLTHLSLSKFLCHVAGWCRRFCASAQAWRPCSMWKKSEMMNESKMDTKAVPAVDSLAQQRTRPSSCQIETPSTNVDNEASLGVLGWKVSLDRLLWQRPCSSAVQTRHADASCVVGQKVSPRRPGERPSPILGLPYRLTTLEND